MFRVMDWAGEEYGTTHRQMWQHVFSYLLILYDKHFVTAACIKKNACGEDVCPVLSRGGCNQRSAAGGPTRRPSLCLKISDQNLWMVQAARSSRARHAMQRRRHLAAGGRHSGLAWDQG